MKLNKISSDMVSRRPDQTAEWLNRLARQVDIVEAQSASGSKKPDELPIATTYSLGVVKIGQNLSITPEGVLSAMAPTSYNYELLFNKPKINNVELIGNKSLNDLGIDIPTKTSDLLNDGSDGTSTYVEADELATVATSGSYSDLLNKPTIGDATLTIQKNGTSVDTFTANATSNKTINITVPTTAADVGALPDTTKYATSLSLTINSSTFVVTGQLKDQDGNNLGAAQTIDLPLESVVVDGSYDSATKEVVLTLQNGNTIRFSVADLVSGLQTEITSANPLDADLVDDSTSTNKFVTSSDITTWNGKQDALTAGTNINIASNTISTQTRGIEYIVGTQASATNLWTGVSTDNGCSSGTLYVGKTIAYYLPVAGNNSAATLNLTLPDGTTTGEIPLRRTVSGTITTHFSAGNVIIFTYDGTYWKMSAYYDSNDNYNTRLYNASIKAAAAITSGRLCIGTSSGYKMIASGVESDITYPILCAGSNVSAGSTNDNFYTIIRSINLQNTKSGWTGVATKEVWLVGTISGSTFTVDSSVFTQTTPTTEDGKIYTPIGITYNTNAIFFCPSNVYWQYKNGEFRPISHSEPVMTGADAGTAGTAGLVPAPAAGDNTKYLSGDGTWKTVSQYALPIASASELGGVKIGSRLTINSSTGVLSADSQTDNNFTNTLKTKLDGIASGAEVNVQSDWTEASNTSDAYIKNKPSLATVATSGSYNDLTNKPTIPAAQVNSDWNANSGVAKILNKPSLATVATSGSYNDLTNKPTIPTVNNATLTIQKNGSTVKTFTANASSNVTANITVPTKTSELTNDSNFVPSTSLATVATSGSYNDLSNKPTIPTVNNATLTIQRNGSNLQTFTANSSTNKTADIQAPKRVPLTGQVQNNSWRRSVIALCEVTTTNNTEKNSYSSGRVIMHRANGLDGVIEINVQAENQYSNAYYFNFSYLSNFQLIDGTAAIDTATGFRPCTFKYNDVWYGGIEVYPAAANYSIVTFEGEGNFNVFGLDYYSVAHTSSGTTYPGEVLNQEVYDSIDYTQNSLKKDRTYVPGLNIQEGIIRKPSYAATLPNKTGTLAMTSDLPTVNNATLTIQKNSTNVATFTANASSNVTANISVPTKTSDLTNDSGFVTDTTSQNFAAQEGSTNPVFDDMTPIKTFTWTVADTTYRPVYQFDNTGWAYDNMDLIVAYRITVTGSGISQVTDIIDRWFSPTSWPVTSIMARTLSTSSATTGYRYLRAVYPNSSGLNNNTYKFGQEISNYNSTSRTIQVDVFKTATGITWNETKPAGTIYTSSTYQATNAMQPYATRGWMFRAPASFNATSADSAVRITSYESATTGSSAIKSGATALVANHLGFQATDGLVYDISNTAKNMVCDENAKIGYISNNINANTAIDYRYLRPLCNLGSTAVGYIPHATIALGDRVYLRCTMDSSGNIHSDNYLATSMAPGYTWVPFGIATASNTIYMDTRKPTFYTLNSAGKLTHINGKKTTPDITVTNVDPGEGSALGEDEYIAVTGAPDYSDMIDVFYPVGSYYETSDTAFDPNVAWGGTWLEDTSGRILVASDTGTFSTVGDTGGAESETHRHWQSGGSDTGSFYDLTHNGATSEGLGSRVVTKNRVTANADNSSTNAMRQTSTYDTTTSTLQPYIVVKRWHRVS